MIGWVKPVAEEITIDDDDDDNEVMVVEGTEKVTEWINQSNIKISIEENLIKMIESCQSSDSRIH